jgi:hypothetical protein
MKHFDFAARLNNEAVSLLLAGRDQIAVEKLTKSIGLMKKRVLTKATNGSTPVLAPLKHSISFLASSLPRSYPTSPSGVDDADHHTIHHASSSLSNLTDKQECYIYNHALSFSLEDVSNMNENFNHVCCAVIIFNIALTHHRAGGRNGNKRCSHRAAGLYNMVLRLLRHAATQGTSRVLKLAALNNLSQIRFEQGDYAQAVQGMDQLRALMKGVQEADQPELENDELQGLIMNVLFLKAPKVAPAA